MNWKGPSYDTKNPKEKPKEKISLEFSYKTYNKSFKTDDEETFETVEILIPYFTGNQTEKEFKLAKWKRVMEVMEVSDDYNKGGQECAFLAIDNNMNLNFEADYNISLDKPDAMKIKEMILFGRT